MSSRKAYSALAIVVIAALVFGANLRSPARQGERQGEPRPAEPAGGVAHPLLLAGSSSCGGRACHGGAGPADKLIQQNEYSTWLVHDKHARAYEALRGERGRRMGENLGVVAEEDARCLACHVNPVLARAGLDEQSKALRGEGVGCEACHGPANAEKSWLRAHTTEAWRDNPARREEMARHRMTDLADLETQAKTCAGCHVGAPADKELGIPARDLNHDLMAAGHPRLNFELGAFRANEPPHWKAAKYEAKPDYEAKSWAVGQAVAARASLELLAHRADLAARGAGPWPEFAESDCFACHADLRNQSWRRNKGYYGARTPGNLPYSQWSFAALPALQPLAGGAEAPAVAALNTLRKNMARPYPNPKLIGGEVREALPKLDALVRAVSAARIDADKLRDVREAAAALQKRGREEMRWEQAEPLALALAALHQSELAFAKQPRDKPMGKGLVELFQALTFPEGYESPVNFRRGDAFEKALNDALAAP